MFRSATIACEDVNPRKRLLVYPGTERYPIGDAVEVVGLGLLAKQLQSDRDSVAFSGYP